MLLRRLWRIAVIAVVLFVLVNAAIYLPGFIEAKNRALAARIQGDMRMIAQALEGYRLDHGDYPPPVEGRLRWTYLPTALTTPTAYMAALPPDPSAVLVGETYGYARLDDGRHRWSAVIDELHVTHGFLLVSPGIRMAQPPMVLTPGRLYDPTNGTSSRGFIYRLGGSPTGRWEPAMEEDALRRRFTYDPSNGTRSGNGIQSRLR